jgi:hypothetical protein
MPASLVSQNVQLLLGQLPASLRRELLDEYSKLEKNYREGKWEPAELDGGKFCEVVYCIVKGYLEGSYPDHATKPDRFADACNNVLPSISTTVSVGLESMRLTIPRVLNGVYDMRNHRGVGHVGGDVNANHMDSTYILYAVKWIMAELIRVFHQTNTREATDAVEALTERTLSYIWEVDGVKQVLIKGMKKSEQVLHLLYGSAHSVSVDELAKWTDTRKDNLKIVLTKLHNDKMLYFNRETCLVTISALGVASVESKDIMLKK